MNLVPHIFRKDVHHLYPEILVYLVLLIAFGLATPASWVPGLLPTFVRLAPGLLSFLIPVTWLVMIARLVHDEVLVGDRQFWITRPYTWTGLLLEKLLFLLVFLHLPLLLVQAYLLHRAHMPVGSALPNLLQYQVIVALAYVLPLLTLAVVTASLGRLFLSILGGLVYIISASLIASRLTLHSISLPMMGEAGEVLIVLTLTAVVLAMYARRPVLQARLALLGLPILLLFFVLLAPTTLLVHHAYAASHEAPVLAFDSDPREQQPGTGEPPLSFDHDVLLQLPVRFEPQPTLQEISLNGAQLTLRAGNGFTWKSTYQSEQNFAATSDPQHIGIYMPAMIYERLRSEPVTFALHIDVQPYTLGTPTTIAVPASRTFAAPGHGLCQVTPDGSLVRCRYPLHNAPAGVTTFAVQDTACDTDGPRHPFTNRGSTDSGGLHLGLDPVTPRDIDLQDAFVKNKSLTDLTTYFLCPGSQVTFTPRVPGPPHEIAVPQGTLNLPMYVTHRQSFSHSGRAEGLGARALVLP